MKKGLLSVSIIGGKNYYNIYHQDLVFDREHRMLRFRMELIESEFRIVFRKKQSVVVRGKFRDAMFYWHCDQQVDDKTFAIYQGLSLIDGKGQVTLFLVVDITI